MKIWSIVLRLPAVLFLVLLLFELCVPAGNYDNSPISSFSLNLESADNSCSSFTAPAIKGSDWNLSASVSVGNNRSIRSTPFDIIIVLNIYYPLGTSSKNDDPQATKVLYLNPADSSLKWARILESASSEIGRSDTGTAQDLSRGDNSPDNPSPIVTNPNGHHLTIMVKPYLVSGSSSNMSSQHMHIVVIDTEADDATHTSEVSELMLGQVPTNDSLVVETPQRFCPAGTGIPNVFSLTEAQVGSTGFRTDWQLVGVTLDPLLVSSQNLRKYDHLPTTLTRVSTSGEELGTVAGVTAVRDGNWVLRYRDLEAAAAAIKTGSRGVLLKELSNINSEAALNITDLDVVSAGLSTGPGFLLRRPVSSENDKQKPFYIPVSWLPATPDDRELRIDDVVWFDEGDYKKQEGHYITRVVCMGEEPG